MFFSNLLIVPEDHPWRCLWLGFTLQITNRFPLRLIILQCSQRFLIDEYIFMVNPTCYDCPVCPKYEKACNVINTSLIINRIKDDYFCFLLVPVGNPAFAQVIRRNLNLHLVTGQNPDVVHPDLSRNVRKHFETVFELDPELRVRKRFQNFAFYLN